MKKIVNYIALFFMFYLVFLIVTLPANVIVNQIKLPKNIELYGVSGTIWQFNVSTIVSEDVVIHELKGDLSFWSLFSLMPKVDLTFGNAFKAGPEGKLTLETNGEQVIIRDADIQLAANEIASQVKVGIPVDAKGTVQLKVGEFHLGTPYCERLTGDIKWPKASVKVMKDTMALGHLKAVLSCEDGGVVVIIDENNDLGLQYRVDVRGTNKISGEGFLKPGDKFPAKIKPLLSFLGQPDNQGRYRLWF
jgi:general secretion pathway protein N